VTLTNGTLTVGRYDLNYTLGNDSATYGSAANLTNDLPATLSTGVNGQSLDITYSSTGDSNSANAGNYSITGTLSNGSGLSSDYLVTLTSGTLTVGRYAFSYTIGNDTANYGIAADFAADLPATISTGVNGQTLDITYSSSGDSSTAPPGNYSITGTLNNGSGLVSDYMVTLTNGTLDVIMVTSTSISQRVSHTTTSSQTTATASSAIAAVMAASAAPVDNAATSASLLPTVDAMVSFAVSTPRSAPIAADLAFLPTNTAAIPVLTSTILHLLGGNVNAVAALEAVTAPLEAAPKVEQAQAPPAQEVVRAPMPGPQVPAAPAPENHQAPNNNAANAPARANSSPTRSLAADMAYQSQLSQEQVQEIKNNAAILPASTTTVVSGIAALTAGYVLLTSKATSWLLSLLMARPLFRQFDPLEILFAWEQEQEQLRRSGKSPGSNKETLQEMVR
jgi:hypothetical protein